MTELPIEGPRACTAADLPGVIALVDAAMRSGTGQTMWTDYPLVYRESNLENIRIVRVGGEVVGKSPTRNDWRIPFPMRYGLSEADDTP